MVLFQLRGEIKAVGIQNKSRLALRPRIEELCCFGGGRS